MVACVETIYECVLAKILPSFFRLPSLPIFNQSARAQLWFHLASQLLYLLMVCFPLEWISARWL